MHLLIRMKKNKKYLFIVLSVLTFSSYGQSIDPSILSQLSPEQIEMAKEVYLEENRLKQLTEESPIIVNGESLIDKEIKEDLDKVPSSKYGYDFFSTMPTSLTAVGDLPLPNDYKISLRDQFTIIFSINIFH